MRAKQKNENKTCAKFDIYIAYREALHFYYSSLVCSIRHTCKGLHEILLTPLLLLLCRCSSRFSTFANARLLFVLTLRRRRLLKKVSKEGRRKERKKTLKMKLYTFLKWVQYPNNLEKLNEIEMKWSEVSGRWWRWQWQQKNKPREHGDDGEKVKSEKTQVNNKMTRYVTCKYQKDNKME